jgi:hypothetical protein
MLRLELLQSYQQQPRRDMCIHHRNRLKGAGPSEVPPDWWLNWRAWPPMKMLMWFGSDMTMLVLPSSKIQRPGPLGAGTEDILCSQRRKAWQKVGAGPDALVKEGAGHLGRMGGGGVGVGKNGVEHLRLHRWHSHMDSPVERWAGPAFEGGAVVAGV